MRAHSAGRAEGARAVLALDEHVLVIDLDVRRQVARLLSGRRRAAVIATGGETWWGGVVSCCCAPAGKRGRIRCRSRARGARAAAGGARAAKTCCGRFADNQGSAKFSLTARAFPPRTPQEGSRQRLAERAWPSRCRVEPGADAESRRRSRVLKCRDPTCCRGVGGRSIEIDSIVL